ncbi:MAG: hypothetical protein ACON4E_05650 [Flavobacteriales bacterium]
MYIGLLHLHSNLPYVLFLLMAVVLVKSLIGWITKSPFDSLSNKLVLFSMITIHIQWTVGAVLYFVSPNVLSIGEAMDNSLSRLYALEHPILMTVAMVLLTISRSKSKKSDDTKNHRTVFILFTIALVSILLCLPPSWL